jgi:hypothetical protein
MGDRATLRSPAVKATPERGWQFKIKKEKVKNEDVRSKR